MWLKYVLYVRGGVRVEVDLKDDDYKEEFMSLHPFRFLSRHAL